MAVKVAINGFGRIGRAAFKIAEDCPELEVVAINSSSDAELLAHLAQYDSLYGVWEKDVQVQGDKMLVDGREIQLFSERDPINLPWKEVGVDLVLESTGVFRTQEEASKHIQAGAKKVIIAAPGKGVDATIVLGVNEDIYDPKKHNVISNSSCTTNCLAPVVKALHDEFTVVKGLMTTVHSYTSDQRLLDKSHKDYRRARAAALSIIPTTTGAAKAIGDVIPELKGKLDAFALRVPTPTVSIVDLTVELGRDVDTEQVIDCLFKASEDQMEGILAVCEEPLVSTDFTGSSYSSIVDAELTRVIGGNLVKLAAWYDNEWGYASRYVDLAVLVASKGF